MKVRFNIMEELQNPIFKNIINNNNIYKISIKF